MKNNLIKIIISSLVFLASFNLADRVKAYFNLTSPPTNNWINFYSTNSQLDPNDEVGVFVNSDNPNNKKICIGKYIVKNKNQYGFLHAYANDSTTPEKDGADPNDILEFKIWKNSDFNEYSALTEPNQVIFDCNQLKGKIRTDLLKRKTIPYDFKDLINFANQWLLECNKANNYCNWQDKNKDNTTNFKDFSYFQKNWLKEN